MTTERKERLASAMREVAPLVPVYGKMCRDPKACGRLGYCPRDPTCGD